MRDLFDFLISEADKGNELKLDAAIAHLGLRGRFLDITVAGGGPIHFSDDTKSAVFVKKAIESAMKCSICGGLLDPPKSVSYDHKTRVRDGGTGSAENADLVHPFCNSGVKN